MIVILIIIIICGLYILSTMCRSGHPELDSLRNWSYAHRGLHGDGVPENSMAAFSRARDACYGIELDVHLLADGNLAVIHDALLKRTTGAEGCVEDLTTQELCRYKLEGTDETIPELSQVLTLISGSVPLIIELKTQRNNYAALCKRVCETLEDYQGKYGIESFDPRCIYWLRKNRSDIIRGQLVQNYLTSQDPKMPWYLKIALTNQMLNFLIQPDFVAYRFHDRKAVSNRLARGFWGVQGVAWTIKNRDEFNVAVSEGWIPIFENMQP